MKKKFSLFLILFASFLFCNKVNATKNFTSSLESSYNFENMVVKKMANNNEPAGYVVTLAYYPEDSNTPTKIKSVIYTTSGSNIKNYNTVITSKFGEFQPGADTPIKTKNSYELRNIINNITIMDFFDPNKSFIVNPQNKEYMTNLCYSAFFVEPIYEVSSNNSYTRYYKYNTSDRTYIQGNSEIRKIATIFRMPDIKTESVWSDSRYVPKNPDSLETGWGFEEIRPLMSFYEYDNIWWDLPFLYDGNTSQKLYQYCYYNAAVCENGELMGTCIKENEYQTTSKVRHCQDSSYQKIDENTCYKDELNPVQSTCSNGGDVNNSCIIYATERYVCNDDEIEDMSMFGKTVSETTVCDTKIISKSKCPSGSTKSSSGKSCVSKKKKHFTCSAGQKLSCTTGDIGDGGAKVKECHCVYYTSHASYTYKLMYPNSGVCNQNNYSDGGTCNNQMQVACSYCGPNDPCNGGHLICTRIKNKTTTTKHTTQASCKGGYSPSTKVVDNGEDYVRCIKPVEEKETEIPIYPSLVYDCPGNAGTDNPICSTGEISYYYNACPSGSTEVAGGYCRYTQNTVYDCNGLTELPNGQCQYHQDLRQTAYNCSSSKYCNPTCPNNPNISLNDCIKQAKSSGITINRTNYKASNYAQAFLLCRFDRCGENATCDEENEALQTKTKDIVSCILEKADELKKDTSDAKISQVRDECAKRYCPKKCYSTSTSGTNASCNSKYEKSQVVTYNENEPQVESSDSTWCNTNPRISKYGRFITQSGNCKLYCRQKESKIALPTNLLYPKRKLSYFEWPTRNEKNHLKIETTNECYIFTDKIDAEPSNCAFNQDSISTAIKNGDNTNIKLNDDVFLEKVVSGSLTGNITINKNVNNPQKFTYKMISNYKMPANYNNKIQVEKENKTLEKDLGYGVIQIPKTAETGTKNLKLNVSNYGFNNQFGSKVDGYTCHYNVVDYSEPPCEKATCTGELTTNNNYYNYNGKVFVKSYTDEEDKVCNLAYSCKTKVGMENALESCVMTYFAHNDWIYDVELMNKGRLESAIKHCHNLCDDTNVEKVIFRKIAIKTPFPGISGKERIPGTNWIGKEEIASSNDQTKKLYEITLTRQNIRSIRNYNKEHGYNDWTLNTDGLSSFIRNSNYIEKYTYNKTSSEESVTKCPKIVTPPQPVIVWDDSLKTLRNDRTGYKWVQLQGYVVEPTGKTLDLENGKYCITTEEKCEPDIPISPIKEPDNKYKIMPPELTTKASKQKICAIVKDKGGSESEVTCSLEYKVDTSPELNVIFSTTSTLTNGWYKNLKVTATLMNDDEEVSINSAKYCITTSNSCEPNILIEPNKGSQLNITNFSSNINAQNVCVKLTTTGGRHITKCSGNVYKVDKTKPTKPTIFNPSNQVCVVGSFPLTVSSNDEHSEIANYQFTYNENADPNDVSTNYADSATKWIYYSDSAKSSFTTTDFVAQRNQYVYIRACDKAGNCSDKNSTYIRIGVAKKSDTACYATVQEAINDGDTGTITLIANVSEWPEITSSKNLTLNLNGKKLYSITNYGTVTINGNGTITGSSSASAINNLGTMTITNGTFGESTTGTSVALSNTGALTVNGGTYKAINAIINGGGHVATINSATIEAKDTAVWNTGSGGGIKINKSTISSAGIFAIYNQSSSNPIIAMNVNTVEVRHEGLIFKFNKWRSNYYDVYVFGATVTSCPSWPTNSSNPQWYSAYQYSDAKGTYYLCNLYKLDFTDPANTWNTHLYNNGTYIGGAEWWTWN